MFLIDPTTLNMGIGSIWAWIDISTMIQGAERVRAESLAALKGDKKLFAQQQGWIAAQVAEVYLAKDRQHDLIGPMIIKTPTETTHVELWQYLSGLDTHDRQMFYVGATVPQPIKLVMA